MSWIDKSFPTETAAMRFSSGGGSYIDWGFRIGLSLVVLFGAVEGFSVGYYYLQNRSPRTAETVVAPPPKVAVAPARATPAPAATPAATAATLSTPALVTSDRLLKDAVALREKGDTASALAKLRDATQRDPSNANAFAEMASVYESVNQLERSNEAWQKIQDIGPSAGAVYETAMLKLRKGAAAATPAPAPTPAVEASPDAAVAAARAGAEGIPEGSTFGIAEVSTTETPDPDADTNLMLRIGVKKKASAVVDHTRVKIQVFFYDTLDDKDIKLTDAEVNYEWLTPNHDWAGATPEVLAVTYVRPKNKAKSQEEALSAAAQSIVPGKKVRPSKATAPDDSGRRKYLGYIVRVYYNDKLQAVRADPTKLINLFPSPTNASSP
jgi:tetratricopeptide (TPR) repeat protein